jgi:hypothetical protein
MRWHGVKRWSTPAAAADPLDTTAAMNISYFLMFLLRVRGIERRTQHFASATLSEEEVLYLYGKIVKNYMSCRQVMAVLSNPSHDGG